MDTKWYQHWWAWLWVSMAVLAVAGVVGVALWRVPWWIDHHYLRNLTQPQATAVTGMRTAILAMLAGALAVVGIIYTHRTLHQTREGQVTDRFTRAISHLASPQLVEQLGGIYALERIMRDSKKDHATIVEVLAGFIREHVPAPPLESSAQDRMRLARRRVRNPAPRSLAPKKDVSDQNPEPRPSEPVQAALAVLGRRPRDRKEPFRLDLARTDLRGAALPGSYLRRAILNGAYLDNAHLGEADLREASLVKAHLDGAALNGAHLEGADMDGAQINDAFLNYASLENAQMSESSLAHTRLIGAHLNQAHLNRTRLTGAWLLEANLDGADLSQACLVGASLINSTLVRANLWGADLTEAKLRNADLTGAELSSANLTDADLDGADLSDTDVSSQQVVVAKPRETTVLPPLVAADEMVQARISFVEEEWQRDLLDALNGMDN
ncbi:pentapeptide repeat-containing protein [Streptomyces sp. NPDC102259]|uniref:pentapeptide repeat-containing protein n=1 Tax=Streptomyces sp. NPDC102259 TaxID=3366148 RepID=UPI0038176AE0